MEDGTRFKIQIYYLNNIRFMYYWTSSIFSPFCLNDVMQIANENNIEIGMSLQSIIIFFCLSLTISLIILKKKNCVCVNKNCCLELFKIQFLAHKPYFWTSVLFWPYLFGITNYNLSWNYQNKTFFFYKRQFISIL